MFYPVTPQIAAVQQFPSPQPGTMTTLHPNTVMVTNAAGLQKPRKLRASCDACSRAKVKCDKVRPNCHRCDYMGILCHYSPSMRLGKPRKVRNPDGTIVRGVSREASCGSLVPRAELVPTPSFTTDTPPDYLDPLFVVPSTPEYYRQGAFMANPFEAKHPAYSDSGSWWNNDIPMGQSSPEVFTNPLSYSLPYSFPRSRTASLQTQPAPPFPADVALSSSPTPSPQFFPVPTETVHFQEQLSSATFELEPLPSPPVSASVRKHDCTHLAFQVLNTLYSFPHYTTSVSTSEAPANDLTSPDIVLSVTDASIDQLFILLSCPCSANPHFSTTISFTITKILSLYGTVTSCSNYSSNPFSHAASSTADNSMRSRAADAGLRSQHILSQLRTIDKLIDRFQDKYCNAALDDETDLDGSGGVYGSLEASLRASVRDTFRVVMKYAPEGLRRQVASQSMRVQRPRTATV